MRDAHDQFLAAGENGMYGRYYYDLKCDQVLNAWRINVKHNKQAVKEDYERKMRNVKKNATSTASSKDSDKQKCVTIYKKMVTRTMAGSWKFTIL